MRPLLFIGLVLSLLSLGLQADTVYKTTDEQGRVIYSDEPIHKDQKAAELPEISTVPSNRADSYEPPSRSDAPEAAPTHYEVHILQPVDESSVPPGQRDLPIRVATDPKLQPNHQYAYYLDGEQLDKSRNPQLTVQEIFRGTHKLEVDVVDEQGRILGTSPTVTVHVHRPSIQNPSRPLP